MSDEKNLSDDLNDMLDDAKDGAKKAADKAEDIADDAKEKAKEFSEDAAEVLSDGKNVAVIAHITLIGWIIALIMNSSEKKTEYASFYIRQMLGIAIIGIVLGLIPIVNFVGWILTVILWIMSLVGALSGKKKTVFLLGNQFQDWFKSL
ncbi:YtxH domain-containing protein [Gaetbulibacter sp. PBL-D1]|uniref:YtxH domain-containing protein n=1 Tax=Gaetbulibacter sp. PBL-D1 TaxID=3422594 RepID=UPI003D2ED8DA